MYTADSGTVFVLIVIGFMSLIYSCKTKGIILVSWGWNIIFSATNLQISLDFIDLSMNSMSYKHFVLGLS